MKSVKVKSLFFVLVFLFLGFSLINCGGSGGGGGTTASAPDAPTGVSATAKAGQVTISWSAVAGATSYNIYWSTTSGVTPANGTKIAGATSPYTQTGLGSSTTYYYVVTAVDSSGESAASSQVSATTPAAQGYTESVLYSFGADGDGQNPYYGGLIMDGGGNLYGTTVGGGTYGYGTVFKLAPNGSGGYTESVLYTFTGADGDGVTPLAGLLMDGSGNLYGTTEQGGSSSDGTVFKLTAN